MDVRVIVFVGVSGVGKTELIRQMCQRSQILAPTKSLTTRPWRKPEDDVTYDFVSRERFAELRDQGQIVQEVVYDGHRYGNTYAQICAVAERGKICMLAVTEEGVDNLRRAGYRVCAIRVTSNQPVRPGREGPDAARPDFCPDYEVENDFTTGGLMRTVDHLLNIVLFQFGTI